VSAVRYFVSLFATGVIDTGSKFAAGMVDTKGKTCHRYQQHFWYQWQNLLLELFIPVANLTPV
jgi:hypothetical protein